MKTNENTSGAFAAVVGGVGDGDPKASVYPPKKKKNKMIRRRIRETYEYKKTHSNNIYNMTFLDRTKKEVKVKATEVSHDNIVNNHRWIVMITGNNPEDLDSYNTVFKIVDEWIAAFDRIPAKITMKFSETNNITYRLVEQLANKKNLQFSMAGPYYILKASA